jgi:hypothetical protein
LSEVEDDEDTFQLVVGASAALHDFDCTSKAEDKEKGDLSGTVTARVGFRARLTETDGEKMVGGYGETIVL